MEHNDPRWPPTNWFIAAENSFEPPDIWEPKLNRPPVPLSGEGFVIGAPPDAEERSECDDPGPTHRRRMMTLWARESLRSGQKYFKVARLCAWTDWAIDKAEDWSPDEKDLRNELADWWVSGQQAVSAYFHFQAWRSKVDSRPVDSTLRQLRNSLIHLDEAELGPYGARSLYDENGKPSKAWAIDKLPDGTLPLVFHASFVESVFGLIDLRSMYDDVAPYQSFRSGDPWDEFC